MRVKIIDTTGCDRHVSCPYPQNRRAANRPGALPEHSDAGRKRTASAGLEKSAYLAGLLHDAGKSKQEYAQYLSEAVSSGNAVRGSVNHTFAGVRLLLDRWHGGCGAFSYSDVTAELLAFSVGSHHGLFDCIDPQQHSGFFHRQTKEGIFYDESRQGFLAQVADEEELEHLFRDAVREMTPMLARLAALSTQADDNEADRGDRILYRTSGTDAPVRRDRGGPHGHRRFYGWGRTARVPRGYAADLDRTAGVYGKEAGGIPAKNTH